MPRGGYSAGKWPQSVVLRSVAPYLLRAEQAAGIRASHKSVIMLSRHGRADTDGLKKTHLPQFDQGLLALIEDLHERGLDKVRKHFGVGRDSLGSLPEGVAVFDSGSSQNVSHRESGEPGSALQCHSRQ